ncbi:hypothetical protein [Spiroplasma diminutum]|uniref:Uncharacterized protein n=1 Tax=Spiroplasma diminutum CUAS-1 TaxID=1276221 RepID=S5LXN2_9MOLU|nr:hypothetical protein [Spiroplasma diminutum]AGR42559.1 hypothetical protein SDIMI_v3c08550 [Spiroplasma diminutum CUAS-1]
MKLKIKNNKINHFLISKKPKTNLVFCNNSNEVILFISTKERLDILHFLNEQLKKMCEISLISIFHMKFKNRNVIAYKSKLNLNEKLKKNIIIFIKSIFLIKWNMKIEFDLIDFNIANINKVNFTLNELHKKISEVLKTKQEVLLPPYPKKLRKDINYVLRKYNNIKVKTIGSIGDRKVKLIYKPEK